MHLDKNCIRQFRIKAVGRARELGRRAIEREKLHTADERILGITIVIGVHEKPDRKSRLTPPAKFSTLIPPSQPNAHRFNKTREKGVQRGKNRNVFVEKYTRTKI